jgi:hypothetical protein
MSRIVERVVVGGTVWRCGYIGRRSRWGAERTWWEGSTPDFEVPSTTSILIFQSPPTSRTNPFVCILDSESLAESPSSIPPPHVFNPSLLRTASSFESHLPASAILSPSIQSYCFALCFTTYSQPPFRPRGPYYFGASPSPTIYPSLSIHTPIYLFTLRAS